MRKFEIAVAAGLIIALAASEMGVFARNCGELRENTLRLHVIANSDEPEDQAIKLRVRDAILEGTGELFAGASSKPEAEFSAARSIELIEGIAQRELDKRPGGYKADARLVRMSFGTTVYDGFTMPAGEYDAVRVMIGEGAGKNWWCVLFPPLCVAPASQVLDGESLLGGAELIPSEPEYIPAFAVVELYESLTRGDTEKYENAR